MSWLLLAGCHVFGTLEIPCVAGMPCARGGGDADTDADADADADADTDTDPPVPACRFDGAVAFDLPTPSHSASVTQWSSPAAEVDGACLRGGTGTSAHSLLDVDGDQKPELLLTWDDCLDPAIGRDAWYAYPNSGAAIGPGRGTLTLPESPFEDVTRPWLWAEGRVNGTCVGGGSYLGELSWRAEDVDGDRALDLLVLRDECGTVSTPPTWTAWLGSESPYSRRVSLSLPTPVMDDAGYWATWGAEGRGTCNNGAAGAWAWTPVELDGDGVPDLVFTEDSCTGTLTGRSEWRVYLGAEDGWTTPARWALPDLGYAGDPAAMIRAEGETSGACEDGGDGASAWGLVELTGDGRPDLVLFEDGCRDPSVGVDHWLVYPNTGAGFSGSPTRWALPGAGWTLDMPPWGRAEWHADATCAEGGSGLVAWSLVDLTGDGAADLVLTADACGWADGRTNWVVHVAEAAGFGAPALLALPPTSFGATVEPFAGTHGTDYAQCAQGGQGYLDYGLYDLDGDRKVELVYTRDSCAGAEVGDDHWLVHRTVCDG